jgi:hypothetical protein
MIYCLSQVKEIPFQLWEIFSPSRQWAKKTMGNVRSSSCGLILKLIAGIENFFAEVGVPVDDPDAPSRPATPEAIERMNGSSTQVRHRIHRVN